MIYQKFSPTDVLQTFVECYFIWHSEDENVDTVIESPPNGFCSIVFNLGDDYHLQNKKYEKLPVPRSFVSGQSIYSYKLFLNGKISIVGIVFKPTALATIFELPTFQYTEERIQLETIFSQKHVEQIRKSLEAATSLNDKIRILEQFVLEHYKGQEPDFVDKAANLILDKNGMLSVSDLMKDIFMSRRNFERQFFKKVGLSPKYYARIRRIGYLLNLVAGKKKVDWKDIFYQCEYYDQSHFIKDFIEFTGRTPQQYLEENTELANYVDKPGTNPINY